MIVEITFKYLYDFFVNVINCMPCVCSFLEPTHFRFFEHIGGCLHANTHTHIYYIYMYKGIYVYMYICIYVCMYLCIYVYM